MTKPNRQESQPDILLIVLDTLRADRLSCYGFEQETTPHLDAYAAESVVFEHAVSPAQWTIPSHGSLFTGHYPSTHGTTQIFDRHSAKQKTIAEYLYNAGYHTVGFCNNPLLGVVENDLDRGFEAFYNYGGILPERPRFLERRPHPFEQLYHWLIKQITRLNQPIQDIFTHNDVLLGIFMHPWIVPLWERNINFKGNTRQSITDFVGYLRTYQDRRDRRPLFTYLNLMETHLPFAVPTLFARKYAPTYHKDSEASAFMRDYNHRSYDWIAPITKPFTPKEHQVLNEMYNAEVAYEDYLLTPLYTYLSAPEVRENTLVIITSDHGEGLDHHNYVGHSLVTYEDLIHVPLIIRFPDRIVRSMRVEESVSTRRIFHTVLEAAGILSRNGEASSEISDLSLRQNLEGNQPEAGDAFSEAYAPLTLVKLIESRKPEVVEQFRCLATRRAIYQGSQKLITIDGVAEELYDIARDPAELDNIFPDCPAVVAELDARLSINVEKALAPHHDNEREGGSVNIAENAEVAERLRQLGYIE